MSDVFELLLELGLNIIGGILEILFGGWWGDFDLPDTKATRIMLLLLIILLGAIILWELR
jgi:hypothetical protein